MKYIYIVFIGVLLMACDTENVNDCFQKSGKIVTLEKVVPLFTKIKVNRDISLVLKEGPVQKVLIETGENLLNEVSVSVVDEQLILVENNICNFVRDYNITKVYVTAPNITEIISSTQFQISSDGVLNYSSIDVLSEDYYDISIIAVGMVSLKLNSQNVRVVGNNLTIFNLSGVSENLYINFAAGDGVFYGANMVANNVNVFHRGTNRIIVNPQNELKGKLVSTGDLITKNQPPVIDVQELYTGRLIYE